MKTLSVITYIIGTILLIASCFTSSVALIWWFGSAAVAFLVLGCIFQFNASKVPVHSYVTHSHRRSNHL